jgi:predicted ferric reductase
VEFTIKALGDFTSTIPTIETGAVAYVDGPYGVFTLERYPAARFVFLAGGVGITPFMGMLRTLADLADPRHFLLIYASGEWDDVTFREELEDLKARLALDVIHVLERPPEGWSGEEGFVTREVLERHLPGDYRECQFFVCGPPPMMESVIEALQEMDVPLSRIQSERFQII